MIDKPFKGKGLKVDVPGSELNSKVGFYKGDDDFALVFECDKDPLLTNEMIDMQRKIVYKEVDGKMISKVRLSRAAMLTLTAIVASDAELMHEALILFGVKKRTRRRTCPKQRLKQQK